MIRLLIPLLALVFTLLSLSCRSQQPHLTVKVAPPAETSLDGWRYFESPDGAFKIMFPEKPQEQRYFIESPAGKLEVHTMAEAGLPDLTIMAQVGHVSPQMMKHYSHIRRQALNQAAAALQPHFTSTQSVELVN